MAMRFNETGLDTATIYQRSVDIERMEGRGVDMIRTVYSDAKYPWPSGQVPWSKEKGGDGIAPPGSKSHMYNSAKVPISEVAEDIARFNQPPQAAAPPPRITPQRKDYDLQRY